MVNLGQLREIKDLREVWPHEALQDGGCSLSCESPVAGSL